MTMQDKIETEASLDAHHLDLDDWRPPADQAYVPEDKVAFWKDCVRAGFKILPTKMNKAPLGNTWQYKDEFGNQQYRGFTTTEDVDRAFGDHSDGAGVLCGTHFDAPARITCFDVDAGNGKKGAETMDTLWASIDDPLKQKFRKTYIEESPNGFHYYFYLDQSVPPPTQAREDVEGGNFEIFWFGGQTLLAGASAIQKDGSIQAYKIAHGYPDKIETLTSDDWEQIQRALRKKIVLAEDTEHAKVIEQTVEHTVEIPADGTKIKVGGGRNEYIFKKYLAPLKNKGVTKEEAYSLAVDHAHDHFEFDASSTFEDFKKEIKNCLKSWDKWEEPNRSANDIDTDSEPVKTYTALVPSSYRDSFYGGSLVGEYVELMTKEEVVQREYKGSLRDVRYAYSLVTPQVLYENIQAFKSTLMAKITLRMGNETFYPMQVNLVIGDAGEALKDTAYREAEALLRKTVPHYFESFEYQENPKSKLETWTHNITDIGSPQWLVTQMRAVDNKQYGTLFFASEFQKIAITQTGSNCSVPTLTVIREAMNGTPMQNNTKGTGNIRVEKPRLSAIINDTPKAFHGNFKLVEQMKHNGDLSRMNVCIGAKRTGLLTHNEISAEHKESHDSIVDALTKQWRHIITRHLDGIVILGPEEKDYYDFELMEVIEKLMDANKLVVGASNTRLKQQVLSWALQEWADDYAFHEKNCEPAGDGLVGAPIPASALHKHHLDRAMFRVKAMVQNKKRLLSELTVDQRTVLAGIRATTYTHPIRNVTYPKSALRTQIFGLLSNNPPKQKITDIGEKLIGMGYVKVWHGEKGIDVPPDGTFKPEVWTASE